MLTTLTNMINMVIREGKSNGLNASSIANKIDYDILDLLIAFVDKHPEFHSYTKAVELDDMCNGNRGSFHHSVLGDVYINRSLVTNLTKRMAMGIGDKGMKQLVRTMLHEHRHAYQRYHKLPMLNVPYTDPSVDYNAYWNHPMEVDAREYAEMYIEDALGYIVYGLRKKYLSHTMRESTTI